MHRFLHLLWRCGLRFLPRFLAIWMRFFTGVEVMREAMLSCVSHLGNVPPHSQQVETMVVVHRSILGRSWEGESSSIMPPVSSLGRPSSLGVVLSCTRASRLEVCLCLFFCLSVSFLLSVCVLSFVCLSVSGTPVVWSGMRQEKTNGVV